MCRWCGYGKCVCTEGTVEEKEPKKEQAKEVNGPSLSEGYDSATVKRAVRRGNLQRKVEETVYRHKYMGYCSKHGWYHGDPCACEVKS